MAAKPDRRQWDGGTFNELAPAGYFHKGACVACVEPHESTDKTKANDFRVLPVNTDLPITHHTFLDLAEAHIKEIVEEAESKCAA